MNRVVGIGANVFDTLITVPKYPDEDTKLRATGVKECGGGPCATGLVAVQKLGVPAAYIGALARDSGGAFLLNDMKRFGMDVSLIDVVPGAHSFSSYVVLSEAAKTRTCVFHKGGLPEFKIDSAKEEAIRAYEAAFAGGLNDPRFLLPYALLIIRDGQYQKAKDFLVEHQKAPGMTQAQREKHEQSSWNRSECLRHAYHRAEVS